MEILRSTIAVTQSEQLALKYKSILEIKRGEFSRYFKKCAHLALCYQGFSDSFNLKEAAGAGRAAFLSCAYDVATDWRKEDEKWLKIFTTIIRQEASQELAKMALDLYQ